MSWKQVCDAADVPVNTLKKFTTGGLALVVANYDGIYRAIPPVCPHMEEPLDESGVIANCVLTCTKHLWSWNLASLAMLGETERPIQSYETKEEDGKVFAFVDKEIVYEFAEDSDQGDDDDFFSR
jgi:toluene monooxygenase system ferredoxin subunit